MACGSLWIGKATAVIIVSTRIYTASGLRETRTCRHTHTHTQDDLHVARAHRMGMEGHCTYLRSVRHGVLLACAYSDAAGAAAAASSAASAASETSIAGAFAIARTATAAAAAAAAATTAAEEEGTVEAVKLSGVHLSY